LSPEVPAKARHLEPAAPGSATTPKLNLNARPGFPAILGRAGMIRCNRANFRPSRGRRFSALIARHAGKSQSLWRTDRSQLAQPRASATQPRSHHHLARHVAPARVLPCRRASPGQRLSRAPTRCWLPHPRSPDRMIIASLISPLRANSTPRSLLAAI